MIITNKYCVTFMIPQEADVARRFGEANADKGWTATSPSSVALSYKKETTVFIDAGKGQTDGKA